MFVSRGSQLDFYLFLWTMGTSVLVQALISFPVSQGSKYIERIHPGDILAGPVAKTALPVQGTWVWTLAKELDPLRPN